MPRTIQDDPRFQTYSVSGSRNFSLVFLKTRSCSGSTQVSNFACPWCIRRTTSEFHSATGADSQGLKRRGSSLSSLNVAVGSMDLAISNATPAKAILGSVSILLTMIRVRFLLFSDSGSGFTSNQDLVVDENETDYVELGLACADVCRVLDRGMNARGADGLGMRVLEAIKRLTECVEPAIHMPDNSLTDLRSQHCGGGPGEDRRAG